MEDSPVPPHRQPDDGKKKPESMPLWVKIFGAVALLLLVTFIGLHLTGRGFGGHGLRGSQTEQSQ